MSRSARTQLSLTSFQVTRIGRFWAMAGVLILFEVC